MLKTKKPSIIPSTVTTIITMILRTLNILKIVLKSLHELTWYWTKDFNRCSLLSLDFFFGILDDIDGPNIKDYM